MEECMKRQSVLMMAATVIASGVLLGAQVQTQPPAPAPQAVAPGQGDSNRAKVADQAFVMDAAMGGMAEVELGKLASPKASNPKVKAFG
jgi:putative membrane protein